MASHTEALRLSAEQNKFLVIFLYSPFHPHCEQFLRETLSADDVISFIDNYLLLYGVSVVTHEGYSLFRDMQACGFPFLALVEPGRPPTVIDRITGEICFLAPISFSFCLMKGFRRPQELIDRLVASIGARQAALTAARHESSARW